jgi:hypothetical protein
MITGYSNKIAVTTKPLLFDEVPSNQLFGFSYRRLRSGYLGNCLQVRRSSDHTALDVGFVDNYLDLNAISTFCGSSQGYLTQWYNQSINANNLRQTDVTQQPMIFDGKNFTYTITPNGDLILAPYFDGVDDHLLFNSTISSVSTYSHFSVIDLGATSYNSGFGAIISDNVGTGDIFHNAASLGYCWFNDPYRVLIPKSDTIDQLSKIGYVHNGATSSVVGFQDSVKKNTYSGGDTTLTIAGINTFWAGGILESYFPEIVGYSDAKSDDTSIQIQNNQNAFYFNGVNVRILDAFPSADAGFSLSKLRTSYTGSAFRVRRSSDNLETNIGYLTDNTLDVLTLLDFCGNGDGFITTWYNQSIPFAGNNFVQTNGLLQYQIVSSGVYIGALKNTSVANRTMANTIEYASGAGVRMTDFIHHRIIGGTKSIAGSSSNTLSIYWAYGDSAGGSSNNLLVSPQFFKNGINNPALTNAIDMYNQFLNTFAVYGMTSETAFYFRTMGMGYGGYDDNEVKTRIMFKAQDLGANGVKAISNQIINFT